MAMAVVLDRIAFILANRGLYHNGVDIQDIVLNDIFCQTVLDIPILVQVFRIHGIPVDGNALADQDLAKDRIEGYPDGSLAGE